MYYQGVINATSNEAEVYRMSDDHNVAHSLNPRLDLRNHSPTGFQWGYGGSGPAQLGLAILADYLKDDDQAQRFYQDFKYSVIGRLPQGQGWTLTPEQIDEALAEIKTQREEC